MHRASEDRAGRVRTTARLRWWAAVTPICLVGALAAGCADKEPPPNPPCELECQDAVALRAIREMMKFAFNMTLQMQPVGMHDLTTNKFLRGTARVFGTAYSNGEQGVTEVDLTYVFTQAVYAKKDDEPDENYVVGLDGTIRQMGKIAVQPSAPTALKMQSRSVLVAGKVYDPPIDYIGRSFRHDAGDMDPGDLDLDAGDLDAGDLDAGDAQMGCTLEVLQNGSSVSGMFCDRLVGFSF